MMNHKLHTPIQSLCLCFLVALAACLYTAHTQAATRLKIVASRAPIYSLVSLIAYGVGHNIQLALPVYGDPNSLDVSDLKHTRFARLVFLFDNKVDSFIYKNRRLYMGAERIHLARATRTWTYAKDYSYYGYSAQLKSKNYAWLSPAEAIRMASVIEKALIAADPDSKKTYQKNMKQFIANVKQIIATIRQSFQNTLPNRDAIFFIDYQLKYFVSYFDVSRDFMPEFSAAILQRSITIGNDIVCVVDTGQLQERDKRFITNTLGLQVASINSNYFSPNEMKPNKLVLHNYYFYNLRYIANSIVRCANRGQ